MNSRPADTRLNLLRIGNITGIIATITVNALANILPINGRMTGELSDLYPNLFVPAGLTFAIWGVIYLLMVVFAADQASRIFRPTGDRATGIIGGWFILSCLANIGWIFAWHYEQVFLSLVAMVVLLVSLLTIYVRLGIGRSRVDGREVWTTHLLMSLYLGWISVATIANVTAWLVDIGWDRFGLGEVFWTSAVVIVGAGLALAMLFDRKDVGYALVVIWAFAGIVIKRLDVGNPPPALMGTLWVSIAAIAIGVVAVLWRRRISGSRIGRSH